ncbi:hypothetical protein J6590_012493 [Homalodisca vitripennis]|nr:hypothetical protein J6590_012493 [Homalodisca vitripennis]
MAVGATSIIKETINHSVEPARYEEGVSAAGLIRTEPDVPAINNATLMPLHLRARARSVLQPVTAVTAPCFQEAEMLIGAEGTEGVAVVTCEHYFGTTARSTARLCFLPGAISILTLTVGY